VSSSYRRRRVIAAAAETADTPGDQVSTEPEPTVQ
jgi:hypothetical protein